jgi:hypothetical protein
MFRGETKCLTDWGIHFGINPITLWVRIYRGWSLEKAFLTPAKPRRSPARKFC